MSAPLDELYLTWLYSQIGSVKEKHPARTHWSLARQLFTKEFVWIIPNDDNRLEDGRDLRVEFLEEEGIEDPDPEWMRIGCSMLEMLVGLSRRLAFEAEGEPREWFWHLMKNLGLNHCSDKRRLTYEEVNDVLDRVIWRTYRWDGHGGLFPLNEPEKDQREVEIWYQLSAYLLERE